MAVAWAVLSGCVGSDVVPPAASGAGAAASAVTSPMSNPPPPPEPDGPFALWLSATRVPPGDVELVAVMVEHGGTAGTFGTGAAIDRWDGGAWVPHRALEMCIDIWFCTATLGPPGPVGVNDIGLRVGVGQPGPVERFTTKGLDVGWYRVTQTVDQDVVAGGVFEVADGAEPPAPLVPVTEPSMTVRPVLVPGTGGAVQLISLVPDTMAPGAYEQAVAGLSESVELTRWDGAAWVARGPIALEPLAPGAWAGARTVTLPALDLGTYRLTRTGAAEPHVGQFWVDAGSP